MQVLTALTFFAIFPQFFFFSSHVVVQKTKELKKISRKYIFETPTPTLTPTPTPTLTPTYQPIPTLLPQNNQILPQTLPTQPTPINSPANQQPLNNSETFIMNLINAYRSSLGLSLVQTNDTTCNLAQVRAQEIATNFSHTGFEQRISSHTLPYPTYSYITENLAEDSDYTQIVTLWKNSPEHAANMRANTPYVCVKEYGNFYAYEGLRP